MESYLKYGALGIILALAILVYRLIANEQKKEQPRKQMIFAIAIFMTFALIAMVIAIPAELIQKQENFGAIFNSNTKADQTAYTWQHYNHPFGYNIDLPDFIKEGDLSSGVQQYVSNYHSPHLH